VAESSDGDDVCYRLEADGQNFETVVINTALMPIVTALCERTDIWLAPEFIDYPVKGGCSCVL